MIFKTGNGNGNGNGYGNGYGNGNGDGYGNGDDHNGPTACRADGRTTDGRRQTGDYD